MNFSFFIAKRYLLNSKNKNVVNIISYISLFGISIGTAALVIILSVFNGFESLVLTMYNSFDPHIKITSKEGKTFNSDFVNNILIEDDGVQVFSNILEEDIFFRYQESNDFARIKGVDKNYNRLNDFTKLLIHPNNNKDTMGIYFDELLPTILPNNVYVYPCNIGISLAAKNLISLNPTKQIFLNTVMPKRDSDYIINKHHVINSYFKPVGFFSVQSDYDSKYIICSLEVLQKMLELEAEQVSSIEVMLKNNENAFHVKQRLQNKLGGEYDMKTRIEQHDFLYKLLNSEKLAIFIILTFILIIASFNIVSSLSMLMIDKKDDIKIFWNLGSSKKQIQNIFFIKGFLGVIIGSLCGVLFGVVFSLLQKHLHFISMHGNFVIDYYPIKIDYLDIITIEIIVILIGCLATYYPARILSKKFLVSHENSTS